MMPSGTPLVGTLTSICCGEGSLPIQGICTRYHGLPARACWGQNNIRVSQSAEYFRGEARATGQFSTARELSNHSIATSVWDLE